MINDYVMKTNGLVDQEPTGTKRTDSMVKEMDEELSRLRKYGDK